MKSRRPIVFLIALLWIFFWLGCNTETSNRTGLPPALGNLALSKVLEKAQAAKMINRMHGKDLGVSENFIAFYGGRSSRNILYVSIYDSAEKARVDLMEMAMKLSKGTRVFSPLTHSGMGDHVLFETAGMGLKHYFYRADRLLIWWQVEPDKARTTIKEVRKFDFGPLLRNSRGQ